MRHSGNYAKVISTEYTPQVVRIKVYVLDELDRFVTVCHLSMDRKQIAFYQGGMELAARQEGDDAQMPLPWAD